MTRFDLLTAADQAKAALAAAQQALATAQHALALAQLALVLALVMLAVAIGYAIYTAGYRQARKAQATAVPGTPVPAASQAEENSPPAGAERG